MFQGADNLKNVYAQGWNVQNVRDISSIFARSNIENIHIEGWNVQGITAISGMFYHLKDTKSITGFPHWRNTDSLTQMESIFDQCESLITTDIGLLSAPNMQNIKNAFRQCYKLKQLDMSGMGALHITDMTGAFDSMSDLETLNIENLDTTQCQNMNQPFNNDSKLSSVTLGENFRFTASHISSLPTPPSSTTTGKWIREDGLGPYTPQELDNLYNTSMAGTWVWDMKPTKYTIEFIAPEGASGSMASQECTYNQREKINTCLFKKFNYHFDHWEGNDGSSYTDGEYIPANTYEPEYVLQLTAVMVKDEHSAEFEGGVADFILHAGERLIFPNLPGGTIYQVWEETPSGWKLHDPENDAGTIQPNETANAKFVNEYIPGTTTVQLIATKLMDGMVPEDGAFTFQLKTNGEVIEEASNNASGTVLFNTLIFRQPGTYTYTISEVRGDNSDIDYDAHEETISIQVVSDGRGNLTATTLYDNDGAKFENITKPGTLTVKKETNGDGDPDEVFTFEIRLTDELGRSLDNINIVSDRATDD